MTSRRDLPADDPGLVEQVLEHLRRTVQSVADEVIPLGPGWVARTRSLPEIWSLNQLRLISSTTPDEAVALADEHQSDLTFRHIVVDHDPTANELGSNLGSNGWKVDRLVMMVLVAEPDHEVGTGAVVDLDAEQMLALMRRWRAEEQRDIEPSTLEQLDEYNRLEAALWHECAFGVVGPTGSPVAITKLRRDGSTAWVEDVYTVPEERGKGYARMLVTHATALARSGHHELTFIIADDNDWPKNLYHKIGFRPIGTTWIFHRAASHGRPYDL